MKLWIYFWPIHTALAHLASIIARDQLNLSREWYPWLCGIKISEFSLQLRAA